MSSHTNGRYEGRFQARPAKPVQRLTGGILALVILLLSVTRLGAEAFKLLAYADVFIGGGRMLIYGDVNNVDLNLSAIPIYTEEPENPDGDYIIKLNDGTTIIYKGHTYELNRNLTTVLVLGIDHKIQTEKVVGNGGQSDAILLVGLDTSNGKTTLLNISREAYAEVEVYDPSGAYIGIVPEQITLAYAYGNARETSCENTLRSVSRLLYGLPISSYLAVDMDGIKEANEAVGGVTVKSLVSMTLPSGTELHEGDVIELHGHDLEWYIRTRGYDLEANQRRMERQKQYLTEFSKLAVAKARDNLSFPVDLFSALSPFTVTDLDITDVAFLSSTFISHGAEFDFRTIEGTPDKLNGSTVLYLDEIDLFEAVLQMFYVQVD
jgi:Transcriptional regulator